MDLSSSYMSHIYSPSNLKRVVTRVARNIKKLQKKLKFQAIAFRGSSGAAVAYPVSMLTGIHLIHVRKSREKSHGTRVEGGQSNIKRYLILDDFIDEGGTVNAILHECKKAAWDESEVAECVGIALYNDTIGYGKTYGYRSLEIKKYKV